MGPFPGRTARELLCLAFFFALVSCAQAQQTIQQRVELHLQSGEYSQALSLVGKLDDRNTADRLLARIAAAQSAGGAGPSSFRTAALIENDRGRADALAGLHHSVSSPLAEGQRGGITEADFDELIELIQETIDPDSWEDNGGAGRIQAFPSGVYVDSSGTLRRMQVARQNDWSQIRRDAFRDSGNRQVAAESPFRKVSITRLERQAQLLAAQGKPLTDAMRHLAGIYDVQFVLVYPESGDIVVAGPAGPWHEDSEGRAVHDATGHPVLNLDDLVVCLRNAWDGNGRFGCSIDPRQENLAAVKQFLADSTLTGRAWSLKLRELLGQQDITVNGIDPRSHAGRVLVEADYRMKLFGMGLEPSVAEVPSYMARLELDENGAPPEMDVIRWWFTMNYDGIWTSERRDAFELRGQGIRLLSEGEFLSQLGERVSSGQSSGPAKAFAADFTEHFERVAASYPIYGELKNLFDLALLAALVRDEGLAQAAGWEPTYFSSPEASEFVYHISEEFVPRQVDSVMNERLLSQRANGRTLQHRLVGVGGGVEFDASTVAASGKINISTETRIDAKHDAWKPATLDHDRWWWD